MGVSPHARMTEDAEARILEEAVETSYEKGGKNVSVYSIEEVSRETVKNKIYGLRFPKKEKYSEKKRSIYISKQTKTISHYNSERKKEILWKMHIIRKIMEQLRN